MLLLAICIIITISKTLQSACDESFSTLIDKDVCYATLDGIDPNNFAIGCQSSCLSVPSGWGMANASEKVYTVAESNTCETHTLVFNALCWNSDF